MKKGTLYCETNYGESMETVAGKSFASWKDTVHYCENNGDKELVVFIASEGANGKK